MTARVFHVGGHEGLRAALERVTGTAPAGGPVAPAPGAVIVVEAFADLGARADIAGGNAFSACRVWKGRGAIVHVAVRADDPVGPQLARFALADGVLQVQADGRIDGLEALAGGAGPRPAQSIETLLLRYGGATASHVRNSQALARLLQFEREDSLHERLQDPETGLLSGAYAALKLEEEWKRAHRFHLPLALVLLDVGPSVAAMPAGPDRRALLAEIAGVFLNECRDIDVLGRFTATTFLFLLPGTPPPGATALVERLLATLAERSFAVAIAPAAGLATAPCTGVADRRDLLRLAEACLERVRRAGGGGGYAAAWE
jgi:GGDEF domain-containing protein